MERPPYIPEHKWYSVASYSSSVKMSGNIGLNPYERMIASRLCNSLYKSKLFDWRQVAEMPVDELLRIPGIGRKSLEVLVKILQKKELVNIDLKNTSDPHYIQGMLMIE